MSRVGGYGGRWERGVDAVVGDGEWEDVPVLASLSSLCKCI